MRTLSRTMATVELKGVCKVFRGPRREEVYAVNDLSLAVADGEFVALLGPSGCGKSTTLRMIAGLESVSSGAIAMDGLVINEATPKDRDLAMVLQNHALFPHLTAFENIAFGLKLRGVPEPELTRRIKEAADALALTQYLDRLPRALSGGQRQRVALGRAMVRRPKAFLFDEPLSNVDAQMRVQLRTEIARLHARLGTTMIYVTHDQAEAMTLADRVVVMKDGMAQQISDPQTLYETPANMFVAGFIGAPPMNFFRGQVIHTERGFVFQERNLKMAGGAGFALSIPHERGERLLAFAEGRVVLGLRPENIHRADRIPAELEAAVEAVEPIGAETLIHLTTGTHAFIAREPARTRLPRGERIPLRVDIDEAYFFNPVSETVIV